MKIQAQQPYLASFIIFKKDDKIALLHRKNTSWMADHFGVISGKVEDDESVVDSAVREAKEEVGVDIKPENLKPLLTCHRLSSENDMTWIDVWFEAVDWEGELYNAEPDVHSEMSWFSLDALPENTIPSHRYCLEQIAAGRTYAEHGWG